MKYLKLLPFVVILPACAAVGKMLPGGEAQAEELMSTTAPAIIEQVGMVPSLLTHNPTLGEAVATIVAAVVAVLTAKKVKNGIQNGKNGTK